MVTAYFDALGSLSPVTAKPSSGGFLLKNALLLVEGTHKSNDGRTHELPAHLVQEYAHNTNLAMDRGVEVPLVLDHSKTIVHKDGKSAKFGEVISDVTCRIITERDLPNSKMKHLLGKVGAFAQVEIRDRIDDVQKGLIKLLSPGLHLAEKRFVEASGVLFPAIHGPALFASLDYESQREQTEAFGEMRRNLDSRYNDLCTVLANIEQADDEATFGNDKNAMRRKAIEDFKNDLYKVFELDESDQPTEGEQMYNPNPYAQQLINPSATQTFAAYSAESETEKSPPLKRRRRGVTTFSTNGLRSR